MHAPILLPVDLSFNEPRHRQMLAFPSPTRGVATPVPDDTLTERRCLFHPRFVFLPAARLCSPGSAVAVRDIAFARAGREGDRL
jgi:hypothetical protein